MDVRTKIAAGDYTTKLPYPQRVVEPSLLRRQSRDLSAAEAEALPTVKADYNAAMAAHRKARDAYDADIRALRTAFRADIEAENEMVGHPKADLLWKKAWDAGHAHGLGEVVTVYEDLLELVK